MLVSIQDRLLEVGTNAADWPGLANREQLIQRERYVARGVSSTVPIFATRGRGAHLEDVDGNVYLDFAAGIGTLAVGHCHPKVVTAVKAQVDNFLHTCFSVAMYPPYIDLARRLTNLVPGSAPKKALFLNSGAEAVENAVKIARAATGRSAVLAFQNSFHGRTLLTMSLTGKVHPYRDGFGPFAPEVFLAPYPYPYRYPGSTEACVDDALARLNHVFRTQVDPRQVAAMIVEPVQGEGGFIVPPPRFLLELRKLCNEHQILFVADEIQTGYGRTGKMFAIEHHGIEPDLLLVGKSIAAGLPLSGVIGRADVMDAPRPGSVGGTYSGNPVACAAALAVLDVFEEEQLLERARAITQLARPRLEKMQKRFSCIGEVRGLGPMLAIELVKDPTTREPAPEWTAQVLRACHQHGLIILKSGLYDNVVRLHMPFVCTDEDVNQGLNILEHALETIEHTDH
ncbi:MAG: 4-aminobutyrate--2-oxoglutarate transaminase [Ktedonobacteraceae bacterium]|nr:4-aminobutyrate--2-oxoglutarate transaminase [Ktedonobacteraceae bacterium]